MRLVALLGLLVLPLLTPLAAVAATVISVGDGDTLRVEDGGRKVTIRVACIDAPEMAQAPYGQRARLALQEMLPVGSSVTLKVQTTDRYGRTVAEVISDNGRNVGLELVQQGNAFAYRQYLQQCVQWAYLDRENLAARYRLGVWSVDGGIERPWDFRAARRAGPRQPQRTVTLTIINDPKPPVSPSFPAVPAGRYITCGEVGSWEQAQQLLREGHHNLDGDGDGEACESLRRGRR
ncbi:MAG: nuclease [Cyanobium sp. CACIAM 14]|nr:MAG: nuclease [Cyanobium sp. CACIAM 14]